MKKIYLLLLVTLPFSILKAATCTWNGSSGNWDDPTKWSCGVVPGAADDVVISSGTVTLNVSPSINNLTQSGGIINGNGNLTVGGTYNWSNSQLGESGATGTVTVAGLTTISIYGGLYGKTLQCNGGTAFSASSFALRGPFNVPAGQTFLITAPGTISGNGGSSNLNIGGTLHKQGPGAFNVESCTLLNSSTFDIDQGSFEIGAPGGTHTGVFNLGAGSTLRFGQTGTNNFNGVTFNAGAGASINVGASTLNFNAGTTMSPSMNLQNYVSYTINDNAGLSWNNVTLTGGSYTANSTTSIAGDLTMNGGVVINGSGNVSVGGNLLQNLGDIAGTVSMTVAGSHTWKAGSLGYSAASTGTITVSGPTTLTTSAVHYLRAKTLNCNGGLEFAGGTFPIENGGTVNVPAGQTFLASLSGGTISGTGNLNIGGTFQKSGSGILAVNVALNSVPVFSLNNGTLELLGSSSHTGSFDIAGGATLNINGGTHSFSGCSFTGGGTVSRTGTGSIGSFTGNTIIPGNSPGTFSFSGFSLPMSGSTYELEIGGLTPGAEHDQIPVSGAVTLGGSLNISFLNGFLPIYGDVFVIMTCTTCSGSFSSINYSGLPANAFDVDLSVPGQVRLVGSVALPVELIEFQAIAESEKTKLTWRTANESNVSHYEIERASSGNDWQYLSETLARNSTREANYSFMDEKPLPGTNYYRLHIVDMDGSSVFSPIRSVVFGRLETGIEAYPNPSTGTVTVKLPEDLRGGVTVSANDSNGRLVWSKTIEVESGAGQEIELSGLPTGVFTIRVASAQRHLSLRIVKQ